MNDSIIKLIPFGSLDDTFAAASIFRVKMLPNTKTGNVSYAESQDRIKKSYDYWSTDAQTMHKPYRAYTAWRLFNQWSATGHAHVTFAPNFLTKEGNINYEQYEEAIKNGPLKSDLDDAIGQLEHRRWNAYMRSIGFTHGIKNIRDRTHPCLVERSSGGHSDAKDRLDLVGITNNCEYKQYDSPTSYDVV